MKSLFRARLALSLLLATVTACSPRVESPSPVLSASSTRSVYPVPSWTRIEDPESAGWSRVGLDSVRARLATLSTTGFMAVVGGRVLVEHGDVRAGRYLASGTK